MAATAERYPDVVTREVSGKIYWRVRLDKDTLVHLGRDAEESGRAKGSLTESEAQALGAHVYQVYELGGDYRAAVAVWKAENLPEETAELYEFEPLTGYPDEVIEQMENYGYRPPPFVHDPSTYRLPRWRNDGMRPNWVYLGNHMAWRTDVSRPVPVAIDIQWSTEHPNKFTCRLPPSVARLPHDVKLKEWRVLFPGAVIRGITWAPVIQHKRDGERLWWGWDDHLLLPFDEAVAPYPNAVRFYEKYGIVPSGGEHAA